MHALSEIAGVLAARSGQQQTLLEILKVLQDKLSMVHGTIMLLTPDRAALELGAVLPGQDSDPPEPIRYLPGEGITGQVVATGQPLAIPSIAGEPRFCDRIHARQARRLPDAAFICVPIQLGLEVVGTLAVDLPLKQLEWLNESLRCLTIVASMIGYDVRTRRLEREEREALQTENLRLRSALEERFRPENIVGNSNPMRDVYLRIRQVAVADTTVLIRGESGTGKELVATAIHCSSPRAKKPFVKVNCAALNESLLESELFGHERGAFTGALQRRIGRIEEAGGGTLFLDEVGDFPPAVQVKLLRVLQERQFERVGSNTPIQADIRIVCATNRNLEEAVRDGQFRNDLYYRVNVFPLLLPPLRERRDDILLLANHFAEKYARRMNKRIVRISTPAISAMMAYHWPGNVRELENCIEHAVLLSVDGVIHSHNLPPTLEMPGRTGTDHGGPMQARVDALERDLLTDALKRNSGNSAAAARELGITPRMVRYKIKTLNIDFEQYFGTTGLSAEDKQTTAPRIAIISRDRAHRKMPT